MYVTISRCVEKPACLTTVLASAFELLANRVRTRVTMSEMGGVAVVPCSPASNAANKTRNFSSEGLSKKLRFADTYATSPFASLLQIVNFATSAAGNHAFFCPTGGNDVLRARVRRFCVAWVYKQPARVKKRDTGQAMTSKVCCYIFNFMRMITCLLTEIIELSQFELNGWGGEKVLTVIYSDGHRMGMTTKKEAEEMDEAVRAGVDHFREIMRQNRCTIYAL